MSSIFHNLIFFIMLLLLVAAAAAYYIPQVVFLRRPISLQPPGWQP
jgi:hypothetical protein